MYAYFVMILVNLLKDIYYVVLFMH